MSQHIIVSGLLDIHGAKSGFLTKEISAAFVRAEQRQCQSLVDFFNIESIKQIKVIKQEHTNKVFVLSGDNKDLETADIVADALVTDLPGIVIGVGTADCVPILLYDKKNKVFAAVHAGWRGAFSGIIQNAVNAMVSLGAKVHEIVAAIGPAIQQYNYQVSHDFYLTFLEKESENQKLFMFLGDDKYLFNLPIYCRNELYKFGIECEVLSIDTYSNPMLFNSYRRICANACQESLLQRQFSLISIKSEL